MNLETAYKTYLCVKKQVDAMGCKKFRVGIKNFDTQKMMHREYTEEQLLNHKTIKFLRAKNANNENIYIAPAKDIETNLVLIDDLEYWQIEKMEDSGLTACVIVETSPENYQAWIKLSSGPVPAEERKIVSRIITKEFNTDIGCIGAWHYGRLAGFTNRKKKYFDEKLGLYPYVKLIKADPDAIAPGGHKYIEKAKQLIEEEKKTLMTHQERCKIHQITDEIIKKYLECRDLIIHDVEEKLVPKGYRVDYSVVDYRIAVELAQNGFTEEQIIEILRHVSYELERRKAKHVFDYLQRTARKAIEHVLNFPEWEDYEEKSPR